MNDEKAMIALIEGKKIKHPNWKGFIQIVNGSLVDEMGDPTCLDGEDGGFWEIYESKEDALKTLAMEFIRYSDPLDTINALLVGNKIVKLIVEE